MTWCAYCGLPATVDIPSTPGSVCVAHAIEFWTGLVVYLQERPGPAHHQVNGCGCRACDELEAVKARKAAAVAAAGPFPPLPDNPPVRRSGPTCLSASSGTVAPVTEAHAHAAGFQPRPMQV